MRSPTKWALKNLSLPNNRPWDFVQRPWLVKVIETGAPERVREGGTRHMVIKKGTQLGVTTSALIKTLHFALSTAGNTGYFLPRKDDLSDLVGTKLDPMLEASPALLGQLRDMDSTRVKQFGIGKDASFCYFREASVEPRMISLDLLIVDEYDLCNQPHIAAARHRLDASPWRLKFLFSWPSLPDYGIDLLYQKSTRNEWFVTCPYCGREQFLGWEKNLEREDGRVFYGCEHCGRMLSSACIREGVWRPLNPGASIEGFHISQMMATWLGPKFLWEAFQNETKEHFYRYRLGQAYTEGRGALDKNWLATKLRGDFSPESQADGKSTYFMGVDQGDTFHVLIAKREEGRFKVVRAEILPFERNLQGLNQLWSAFRPRYTVIDGLPNKISAVDFASKHRGTFWAIYHRIDDEVRLKKKERKIVMHKHDTLDRVLLKMVPAGQFVFASCPQFDVILDHLSNLVRDSAVYGKGGPLESEQIIWRKQGPDDFAQALNYLAAAARIGQGGGRLRTIGSTRPAEVRPSEQKKEGWEEHDRQIAHLEVVYPLKHPLVCQCPKFGWAPLYFCKGCTVSDKPCKYWSFERNACCNNNRYPENRPGLTKAQAIREQRKKLQELGLSADKILEL